MFLCKVVLHFASCRVLF